MITLIYISCIVAALVGVVLLSVHLTISGTITIMIAFILMIATGIYEAQIKALINIKEYPTALDVYRGKTTLEITYRDSVAIDSTVVYKMK